MVLQPYRRGRRASHLVGEDQGRGTTARSADTARDSRPLRLSGSVVSHHRADPLTGRRGLPTPALCCSDAARSTPQRWCPFLELIVAAIATSGSGPAWRSRTTARPGRSRCDRVFVDADRVDGPPLSRSADNHCPVGGATGSRSGARSGRARCQYARPRRLRTLAGPVGAAHAPHALPGVPGDPRAGVEGHADATQRHDRGDRRRAGRQTRRPGGSAHRRPVGCLPTVRGLLCRFTDRAERCVPQPRRGRTGSTPTWGGSHRGAAPFDDALEALSVAVGVIRSGAGAARSRWHVMWSRR
jgi:hypothetical protein